MTSVDQRGAQARVRRGAEDLRREPAGALLRGAAPVHGRQLARRRAVAVDPAAAAAVERRTDDGARQAGERADGTLPAQASRLRAAARLRRLVGGAAADAARAGRLRHRCRASTSTRRPARAAARRASASIGRSPSQYLVVARRRRAIRLRPARCSIRARSARCVGERALNTAVLATSALLARHADRHSARHLFGHAARVRLRSIVRAISVARHLGAAADRIAGAGVPRGAHRMVSGRRHDLVGRHRPDLGAVARRSRAPPAAAGAGAGASRWPRRSSACSRKRSNPRRASGSWPPAARAASIARDRSSVTPGRCRFARCSASTA